MFYNDFIGRERKRDRERERKTNKNIYNDRQTDNHNQKDRKTINIYTDRQ